MSERYDLIQQSKEHPAIWLYWKFSKCQDWGSREYLERKYPDVPVYDVNGVGLKERNNNASKNLRLV